ncbi:MAG TPA: hypothetical protein VHV78_01795 [Gemmatimonadaceae bacterium]|nr:hypothetical protein [Gemmatimonadaceae bacterium]
MKRLDGLPSTRQTKLLSRVLRENASAFFLQQGPRLYTSDVDRRADGSAWAAAFDAGVADDVVAALRKRGLTRVVLVPSVSARFAATPEGAHRYEEDGIAVDVQTTRDHHIASIRRLAAFGASTQRASPTPPTPPTPPTLATRAHAVDERLSAIGSEYATALAAAVVHPPRAAAWRAESNPREQRVAQRIRLGLSAATFVACAAAALIAPGVRAHRIASSAGGELAQRQASRRQAVELEASLARVSGELERINRFESKRGRMTELLGALAQAIPESTAMVTLRVDSVEASFVAVAPHAADILPELSSADGVYNPRIAGSVIRETQGGTRLERATVRFQRQPSVVKAARTTITRPPAR